MDNGLLITIIIVAAVVIVLLAGLIVYQRRKSRTLRSRYGPEYDRLLVEEHGRTWRTEAILEKREKRVRDLHIRKLTPAECDQFTAEWRRIQEQFVDDPTAALTRAESLVDQALRTRGYPMSSYQEAVTDISVTMPRAADDYRSAHEIADRHARGNATTEELRRAMQLYREIFENALEVRTLQPLEVHR